MFRKFCSARHICLKASMGFCKYMKNSYKYFCVYINIIFLTHLLVTEFYSIFLLILCFFKVNLVHYAFVTKKMPLQGDKNANE